MNSPLRIALVAEAGLRRKTLHFDRSASRLEDLARVPPSRLRYAQLCDVAGPRPTDMAEILRQACNERLFPGDGECDLAGLLRCLPSDIALDKTRELLARLARDVFDFTT
jgi:hypothetical protein